MRRLPSKGCDVLGVTCGTVQHQNRLRHGSLQYIETIDQDKIIPYLRPGHGGDFACKLFWKGENHDIPQSKDSRIKNRLCSIGSKNRFCGSGTWKISQMDVVSVSEPVLARAIPGILLRNIVDSYPWPDRYSNMSLMTADTEACRQLGSQLWAASSSASRLARRSFILCKSWLVK